MIETFLRTLFRQAQSRRLRYAVMRNYDQYPLACHKPDMSMLLAPEHEELLVSIFCETCLSLRLLPIVKPRRTNIVTLLCFEPGQDSSTGKPVFLFKIDARTYEIFRSTPLEERVSWLNQKVFFHDIETRTVEQAGARFCILGPRDELAFMLMQWRKKQLPHYRKKIEQCLEDESVALWFASVSGVSDAQPGAFLDDPHSVEYGRMLARLIGSIRRRRFVIGRMGDEYRALLIAISRRRLAPVIYFSGPDGCGKTTVCDGIRRLFREAEISYVYFYTVQKIFRHVGYRILWIRGILGRREGESVSFRDFISRGQGVADRDSGSPSWRARKLLIMLFMFLDIWMSWAGIFFLRAFGRVILVETSPFDLFTKYHMPTYPLIEKVLIPLIPRPSVGFLLYAAPSVITERKAELTEAEILAYYEKFQGILARLDEHIYCSIDTSGDETSTLCEVVARVFDRPSTHPTTDREIQ